MNGDNWKKRSPIKTQLAQVKTLGHSMSYLDVDDETQFREADLKLQRFWSLMIAKGDIQQLKVLAASSSALWSQYS